MGLFDFLKTRSSVTISAVITGAMVTGYIKDGRQEQKFNKKIDAKDKVIIVTGANTGIGFETARELAKRGAHVYMACRYMRKCEQAREKIVLESANPYVYCRQCDLSSMASIRAFAKRFESEEKRLDVLINNAGVMRCPRSLTSEGIEMQLGVNHIGHFLLTHLLLDLLKKSAPSRIVVVSSIAHTRGQINATDLNSDNSYDPGDAYNQSKLANVMFTRELARRLDKTGVVCNAVNPGLVDTDITRHMGVFKSLSGLIFKPLVWPFLKTAVSGAQTILYVALDPKMANKTGLYYTNQARADVSDAAKDATMSAWLWKVSEKWTGLSDASK